MSKHTSFSELSMLMAGIEQRREHFNRVPPGYAFAAGAVAMAIEANGRRPRVKLPEDAPNGYGTAYGPVPVTLDVMGHDAAYSDEDLASGAYLTRNKIDREPWVAAGEPRQEFRIIIPLAIDEMVSGYVERTLAEIAGGWTRYEGRGGWIAPNGVLVHESVAIIDAAYEVTPEANAGLRFMAELVAVVGSQETVYVRWPGEFVELIQRPRDVGPASGYASAVANAVRDGAMVLGGGY